MNLPITYGNKINTNFITSAPITRQALEFIKKYSDKTLLEIGCGSGIYAKLLRESGLNVIATDACRLIKNTLPDQKKRMARFTNKKAINIIEKNAVNSVREYGNEGVSLFLSFPIPEQNTDTQYDESALIEFRGNKFFLIANYTSILEDNLKNYSKTFPHDSTGSSNLHKYLSKHFTIKDKLLLRRISAYNGSSNFIYCYLIYLLKKNQINNNNNEIVVTNVQKAKPFSVGDYVMVRGLPNTYVIFRINPITSRITLCNLSIKNGHSENMYKTVNPDQLVKKRSYSNTIRGRTTYNIPEDIQKIINNSKNK